MRSYMTPHINAMPQDYAETVLMPGDPLRAKYLAEKFLTQIKLVNSIRNCYGFTGYYNDKRVSFQASGMGQPSLSIYATELFTKYNVNTIIRIGTCGAFHDNINCGDVIIPESSYTEKSPVISASCDSEIKFKIIDLFKKYKIIYHTGEFISNDNYYQEDSCWWKELANKGVLGVDMETHALYNHAKKLNKKAITINLVSDNLTNGKDIGTDARVTSSEEVTKAVLDAI